jgi:cytochrome c peroxidase
LLRDRLGGVIFKLYSEKSRAFILTTASTTPTSPARQLNEAEARGLKLFENPHKGNCSSRHIDRPSRDGRLPPTFTDYQFEALGVPRNKDIPATSDPN